MRYYDGHKLNQKILEHKRKKLKEKVSLSDKMITAINKINEYKYALSLSYAKLYAKNQERKKELYLIKYGIEKQKKKIKYSKYIVGLSISAVIVYTIAAFLLQKNIGYEVSPTLTTCFYSFFGVELLAMTGIKVSDTINETKFQIHESNITASSEDDVG